MPETPRKFTAPQQDAPLVVSMGEPAGVVPDLILKIWHQAQTDTSIPPFLVIADPDVLTKRADCLNLQVPITALSTDRCCDVAKVFYHSLPVLPVTTTVPVAMGQPNAANAKAVTDAIEVAVNLCRDGKARALVTLPIHKAILAEAKFPHPGHTEFLGKLSGEDVYPVMMLATSHAEPGLRVVPLTVHCALSEVPKRLQAAPLKKISHIVIDALIRDFGISAPRLAFAALNPHAGEDGLMGTEEQKLLTPLIEELLVQGANVQGPWPADTLFRDEARETYDAALCMYHDQALIPLKVLDFHGGVNITLGLPFIRTSPDHGTALPLAGTGQAKTDSTIAAIRMAHSMSIQRAKALTNDDN